MEFSPWGGGWWKLIHSLFVDFSVPCIRPETGDTENDYIYTLLRKAPINPTSGRKRLRKNYGTVKKLIFKAQLKKKKGGSFREVMNEMVIKDGNR